MAYRSCDLPAHEDLALRDARRELWLIDGLLAIEHGQEHHVKWYLLVLAVWIGLGVAGLKVACAAMLVLLVPVLGWYGGPERALRREAKARGMTSGTIARVFAIAGHGSLAGLRESVVTRVMWRTWCSGQPTNMAHCLELAERLRGQGRLDSLQRWFVEQLEPMRAQSHHSESSRRRTP